MVEMHQCVDLAQEFDGLEVFATAMPIGHPFAGLARIIEVKHRGHRVDAEAIDVKTLQPRQGGADQKAADLVAAVVEDQRTPILVLPEARVGVLIEMRAVKAGQRKEVAREVSRHPVGDDANVGAVQRIDHRHEIERCPETVRRRVETRDLIAPRAIERVF